MWRSASFSFVVGALGAAACAPPPSLTAAPVPEREHVAIIVSERGPRGARLVAIDERGDRRFDLLAPPAAGQTIRDTNPSVSPDGRWVAFASTRGRRPHETSVWIAPIGVEAAPARLTDGAGVDSHPVWTHDGGAIVFASTRGGADFDLWTLAVAGGRAAGAPVRLTDRRGHEVTPTVARDGAIIYAAVTPRDGGEVESHLEERAPDGAIRALTEGPADSAPALSPDGATLAFARPVVRDAGPDSELWSMPRAGGEATRLVDLPLTDESGPVWSRDGRYVFATSVLRGAAGRPLFASVVHVDRAEQPARARMLRDRAGALVRLTPAIATARLDARALRADPEYLPELARIMAAAIERAAEQGTEP